MAKLLVIDDSLTIRKLLEITFRGSDIEVLFASSGREGVELARATSPAIILLDFVLPDMRGYDVCRLLGETPHTANIPVVVMTAKDDTIRQYFTNFTMVKDILQKPVAPEALTAVVRARILTGSAAAGAAPAPARTAIPAATAAAAAKIIFSKLQKGLASIPSWIREQGDQSPAVFFARRLLSPEVVGELVEALAPLYKGAAEAGAQSSGATEAPLSGRLNGMSVAELSELFSRAGRTGVLKLSRPSRTLYYYFANGELAFASSNQPSDFEQSEGALAPGTAPGTLELARNDQRETGKPVQVALAERGALAPGFPLRTHLQAVRRTLIQEGNDARDFTFAWRPLGRLPEWIESYGRPLSTVAPSPTYSAPQPAPATQSQAALEKARRDVEQIPTPSLPALSTVFDRGQGFTHLLKLYQFDVRERRFLSVLNGQYALADLANRIGLDFDSTQRLAHYLQSLGVIRTAQAHDASEPVLLMETDLDGFHNALAAHLKRSAKPLRLVSLSPQADVVEAAMRERPRAVIVNTALPGAEIGMVQAFRSQEALKNVSLIGVVELSHASRVEELQSAGFDAVYVKPVALADLDKWLRV